MSLWNTLLGCGDNSILHQKIEFALPSTDSFRYVKEVKWIFLNKKKKEVKWMRKE